MKKIDIWFRHCSKATQAHDEFFKQHKKTLLRYEKLMLAMMQSKFTAQGKIEMLSERGALPEEIAYAKKDKFIEMNVHKAENSNEIAIDIFDNSRYNKGNKRSS